MINNENIQQEIDRTLESLNGLERAAANPFLFTRIKARMQSQSSVLERVTSFLNRPSVALAVLVVVIAINAWAVFGSSVQNINQKADGIAITDIAEEYTLVANNNYYYENIPVK